jgi:tetratricopeptide (TPR) repeat protein
MICTIKIQFKVLLLCFLLISLGNSKDINKSGLDSCIIYYQDGEYIKSVDSLKALLPSLSKKDDLATAYKYLAFSYVMLEMVNTARETFNKALEEYPEMELDTVKIPPNITAVFKEVKKEKGLQKQKRERYDKRKKYCIIGGLSTVVAVVVILLVIRQPL